MSGGLKKLFGCNRQETKKLAEMKVELYLFYTFFILYLVFTIYYAVVLHIKNEIKNRHSPHVMFFL